MARGIEIWANGNEGKWEEGQMEINVNRNQGGSDECDMGSGALGTEEWKCQTIYHRCNGQHSLPLTVLLVFIQCVPLVRLVPLSCNIPGSSVANVDDV